MINLDVNVDLDDIADALSKNDLRDLAEMMGVAVSSQAREVGGMDDAVQSRHTTRHQPGWQFCNDPICTAWRDLADRIGADR